MARPEVKIPIVGDSSKYKAALNEAEGATNKFGGTLKKLAKLAVAAFAVDALVDFGAAAVKAAAEDEKGQRTLAEQVKRTTGATDAQVESIEAFILQAQNATGVMDDQLRPAYGNIIRATKDTTKAQDLLTLAMDISAATGKDIESVSLALAKAYNGNVSGLQRMGINMKGATGEALSFSEAQRQLTASFGGAAAVAADTAEGKYKVMQARFSELKEEIGAKLLPVLSKLAEWMTNTLIPAVEKVVAWFDENWPKIEKVVVDVFDNVKAVITEVVNFIQALWSTFGETIVEFTTTYFGTVAKIIGGFFDIIKGIFNVFKGLFTGDWGLMWDGIKGIVLGVKDIIVGAIQGIWNAISSAAKLAWDGIKGVVTDAWDSILGFFGSLPDRIGSATYGMFDGIKNAFKSAINWIIRGWNSLEFTMPGIDTHIPGVGKIGGFTVGVPDIPQLASGTARVPGALGQPFPAILHGGEAVIPAGGNAGGGPTINITVNAGLGTNGRDVGLQIAEELRKAQRTYGALGLT